MASQSYAVTLQPIPSIHLIQWSAAAREHVSIGHAPLHVDTLNPVTLPK
jgi:hypothetical protein